MFLEVFAYVNKKMCHSDQTRIIVMYFSVLRIRIRDTSVVDPHLRSGRFFPQGSGIRNNFFPYPGSGSYSIKI
jgi:hypothetical protein